MVFLDNNLKNCTNEEIRKILILIGDKKKNRIAYEELLKKYNLEKENIESEVNNRVQKCNKIIAKERTISEDSHKTLIKESLIIREMLKGVSNMTTSINKIKENDKEINNSINDVVLEKEKREKRTLRQRLFKHSFNKNKAIEPESIESKIKERKKVIVNLDKCSFEGIYLKNAFLEGKISKQQYYNNLEELKLNTRKVLENKRYYDNMIRAYNRIKELLDSIMSYDIDKIINKRKNCSYKQYREYLTVITKDIKNKNEEILGLKQFLTEGLIESLSSMYDIKEIKKPEETKEKVESAVYTNRLVPKPAF